MNLLRKHSTKKQKRLFSANTSVAKASRIALFGLCVSVALPASALLSSNSTQSPDTSVSISESSDEWKIKASNPTSLIRENELIRIPAADLPKGLNVDDHLLILLANQDSKTPAKSLSYQWAQSAAYSGRKELVIQASFEPKEDKMIRVIKLLNGGLEAEKSSTTYAELAVRLGGSLNEKEQFEGGRYTQVSEFQLPKDHTIGNKLFKYEGFGWESELVGYRYYFDNRGAVDIFGKQEVGLALEKVGLDGGDYHVLNDWGMDVLKVGGSLGIGALAAYADGKVVKVTDFRDSQVSIRNEAIYASATLSASKWQVGAHTHNLQVTYRIAGGQRLTEVIGEANGLETWASGIVNHIGKDKSKAGAKLLQEGIWKNSPENDSPTWCYRATYGKQSLNDDNLGMALFYPCANSKLIDSELNVAVAMQSSLAHYYFLAGWEAENNMFATEQGFTKYLKQTQIRLNKQIAVSWLE